MKYVGIGSSDRSCAWVYGTTVWLIFCIWQTKAKGCGTAVPMAKETYPGVVIKKMYVLFLYVVPGIRHTYKICVSFSYSARDYIIVYICGAIKCGNKMMAFCPRHYPRGQIAARHPSFLSDFTFGTWWSYIGHHTGCTHIFFGTMFCWDGERATKWHHNV